MNDEGGTSPLPLRRRGDWKKDEGLTPRPLLGEGAFNSL